LRPVEVTYGNARLGTFPGNIGNADDALPTSQRCYRRPLSSALLSCAIDKPALNAYL
jgi:hypothetical protein